MGRKFTLILIVIILLALGVGYGLYTHKAAAPTTEVQVDQKTPSQESTPVASSSESSKVSATTSSASEQGHYSSGEEEVTPDIMVFEIIYDGKTFTPNKQEIKVGDVVMFTNKTSGALKVVNNSSKTSSTTPGASSPGTTSDVTQYTFSKPGTWEYAADGNNKVTGQLIVKP